MSIKKLFEHSRKSKNFLSETTEKTSFDDAESAKNVANKQINADRHIPHVDYSDPASFVKYGSARLYYESAFTRILDFYPYDGSEAEINKFHNEALDIEKYVLENRYPRTNGFVTLAKDGYTVSTKTNSYGIPVTNEYIDLKGGPGTGSATSLKLKDLLPNPYNSSYNASNIYDETIYQTEGLPSDYGSGTRTSNLRANFNDGVTLEFWLKTGSMTDSSDRRGDPLSSYQVVFDLWNNENSSSVDYGRLRIELTGTVSDDDSTALKPFVITVESGSVAGSNISRQTIGSTSLHESFGDWNHYALSMYNTGSNFAIELYVNGDFHEQQLVSKTIGEFTPQETLGRIGALITTPFGEAAPAGAGRLSGSLDEFRYWKIKRTEKQIGRNWFTQVRGGANTDISNTTLGVYYKFNEGITGDATTDSIVLDYAGRVTNGTWTGYSSGARNTGSAMVSASAATREFLDPIIRPNHPDVTDLKSDLIISGTSYDYNNNAALISLVPGWIQDEESEKDNSDLRYITHVMGTYFDKLYLQISEIPKLRHLNYVSASNKPFPFASHLPQSLGLYSPEIFIDSTVLEKFTNRNPDILFENDLTETKNLIYQNLYNNLTDIFKAKGTEKSIRNVFRCFNIGDNVLSINISSNNEEFLLRNNLKLNLLKKNVVDFSNPSNTNAVVYQASASLDEMDAANASGSIDGADEQVPYGFTYESNIIFPDYTQHRTNLTRDKNYNQISLFGMVTVGSSTPKKEGTTTTFESATDDVCNFRVYAIRDEEGSKNAYFKLTSSFPEATFESVDGGADIAGINLTSSIYKNVYDDEPWNFSVRLKPKNYPRSTFVASGSDSTSATSPVETYDVIFTGINPKTADIRDTFILSQSVPNSTAKAMIRARKRAFIGADRTDLTGELQYKSDVQVSSIAYWGKYLSDEDLIQHAVDFENVGLSSAQDFLSPLDTNSTRADILNRNSLVLNWNFRNITGSDESGAFSVQDFSSGSSEIRDKFGWLGKISGYQYTGVGYGFKTSSADVVQKKSINTYKFINPERAVSSDMIRLFSEEDEYHPDLRREEIIPNYVYTVEKSIYNAVSEEMLDFMAGAIDFHSLIGHPVNRYRERYKEMEKLRAAFFRRVKQVTEVEKYINYYKWFDDSITSIISQLIPASAEYVDDIQNVIESHVLERNKYKSRINIIENQLIAPVPISTIDADGGSPESGWTDSDAIQESEHGDTKIEEVVSEKGQPALKEETEKFTDKEKSTKAIPRIKGEIDKPRASPLDAVSALKGGVNFPEIKNLDFAATRLRPAGPVDTTDSVFVPLNIMIGFSAESVTMRDKVPFHRPPEYITKDRKVFHVQQGKDWELGIGYKNAKSDMVLPFNIMSSNVEVNSGYNSNVVNKVGRNLLITNLHNDVYGSQLEVPMQGPFTNYAVGGHQSRHVSINTGTDTQLTRPEAWRIRLGTCSDLREGDGTSDYLLDNNTPQTGGFGLVGPDYPPPEYSPPAGTVPYPYAPFQKAYLYRDGVAKRPVNIRNIKHTTGSTVLGNYNNNYEVIHSFGAYNNPRQFIESQPALPSRAFENTATSSTSIRTFLDIHRGEQDHYQLMEDYSTSYLNNTTNKSIIVTRFSHAGGIEIQSPGYQDFRASEYSVYNTLNNRNLTVKKPSQGPSGTLSEAHGGTPSTSRVFDVHGKDYGLYSHTARHTARFGRDSLHVEEDQAGATYEQLPGFHKVHRNRKQRIVATNEDNTEFKTSSVHDNLNVSHPIPRSDRQYRWLSSSVVDIGDIRYAGYQRTNPDFAPYRTSSAGRESYWDFVSSSNASIGSIYQPANRLNIIIVDPVNRATNTIGFDPGTDVSNYTNTDLVGSDPNPNYLNQLLSKRQATFGWGWNKFHQSDNKVFIEQRKANELVFTQDANKVLNTYRMPPVSMKGRTALINMDVMIPSATPGTTIKENVTLRATNTNEKIFFNETDLNNITNMGETTYNPANNLLGLSSTNGYKFNWFLYSQNVFPSMRNEFVSMSVKRMSYDNLFWRDDNADRITVGNTVVNSFGVAVSQSSWPLDPPVDFLTRTLITVGRGDETASLQTYNITETQAGELHNTYGSYFTIDADGGKLTYGKPGALYSRKHCLGSPKSVVSPSGPRIAETGSFTGSFIAAEQIETLAGEAVWEAGEQAGIVEKLKTESVFVVSASNPWWNNYEDFRENLRLKAKGFAVIPEFRMSERVAEYYKYGTINKSLKDTFTIPGTAYSSSQTDFYKDFSNTDFLQGFLGIDKNENLSAKEIRLTCMAAIKYNAYKGFYPVQRTLDLTKQFYNSFEDAFQVSHIDNNGSAQSHTNKDNFIRDSAGGVPKIIFDKLYSPGILYNSIKSGLAVDYPIVSDPSKMKRTVFGTDSLDTSLHTYALTIANATSSATDGEGYDGGSYWDKRIPFDGIINPRRHLPGTNFLDMESHPSMSLDAFNVDGYPSETEVLTGSLNENGDEIYNMMARNFFGECSSFFLKNGELSRLESATLTDDLKFKKDEVYMARIKLRRSNNGERTYEHDYDSNGSTGSISNYAVDGAKAINNLGIVKKQSYPIPQDPSSHPTFKETFTMYSRPSAFGPPVAGRPSGSRAVSGAFEYAARDSFEGFNPAFTPPYMNGESWVDLVFRPTASVSYDLERILSEVQVKSWRFDPGYRVPTSDNASTATFTFSDKPNETTTITLTDVAGTSVVFEVDDTGDGAAGSNTAVDGAGGTGFATALHTAINASSLAITSTNPSSGKVILTQDTAGVAGNVSITSTLTTGAFSVAVPSTFTAGFDGGARASSTSLIPIEKSTDNADFSGDTPGNDLTIPSIYDGYRINNNSMQLTSSVNIFGIERVLEQAVDKFGNVIETRNKTAGSKWIIQPKWETPMLNFNDEGVHGITVANGTLTVPTYGSASTPRGMWHQFGNIPENQKTGVFLEIGDIPEQWLKNHYDVLINESIYNNFLSTAKETKNLYKRAKSLASLCGFDKTNTSTKLGQIKDKMIVSEAVVAIPYIVQEMDTEIINKLKSDSTLKQSKKKFITIPKRRFEAALKENEGSQQGDSLGAAGESIRKLKQSMEKYVFPPEFDFLNNKSVKPIAMYIFEFDYEFDKDDLSYMWQNLAPRDYKKLEFKTSEVSHNIANNELINEKILSMDNLRWMVFKVKQRAQKDYYELIADQAGEASTKITQEDFKPKEYKFGFNWPYDYLSFVELIKMDVDILVKKR